MGSFEEDLATFKETTSNNCFNGFPNTNSDTRIKFCNGVEDAINNLTGRGSNIEPIDNVEQRDAHDTRRSAYIYAAVNGIVLLIFLFGVACIFGIHATEYGFGNAIAILFGGQLGEPPDVNWGELGMDVVGGIADISSSFGTEKPEIHNPRLIEIAIVFIVLPSIFIIGALLAVYGFEMFKFDKDYYERIENNKSETTPCDTLCPEECERIVTEDSLPALVGLNVLLTFVIGFSFVYVYGDQEDGFYAMYGFVFSIAYFFIFSISLAITFLSVFVWYDETNRYLCDHVRIQGSGLQDVTNESFTNFAPF